MMVHMGFRKAYQTVENWVIAKTKALAKKHKDSSIKVTGHSLGGALAHLCALQLTQQSLTNEIIIYTFGQPRVGDKAFAEYSQQQLQTFYRVIHDDDIVARIPNFNYYHAGK